jgi:ferric-dicitrate binding protein FerR (iron transport regulator)
MQSKKREDYEVEDFVTDESFINYHFQVNAVDTVSWTEWLAQHPEKNMLAKQAIRLIQTLSFSIDDKEYTTEFEKIKKAITGSTADIDPFISEGKAPFKSIRKSTWVLTCVLLTCLIGAGYFLFHKSLPASEPLVKAVNNGSTPRTLVLSDSTSVTLAPGSTLEYPNHFHPDRRDVYLEGEASFYVKRNETAPFKVFSQNIVATVLGTVFQFKKGGDSVITVELLKGRLDVQMNEASGVSKSLALHPNEKAVYLRQAHTFFKSPFRSQADIAFHQSNFEEIANKIYNAFGITLINKSTKSDWQFTGEFKQTTAEDLIAAICLVKKVTAETKADTVYIK